MSSNKDGIMIILSSPSGAGKTTLLKTIIGEIPPLGGNSNIGHNVNIGYYRQGSDEIPDHLSVIQALLEIKNMIICKAVIETYRRSGVFIRLRMQPPNILRLAITAAIHKIPLGLP